ncbi:hypothetical protein EV702DRAFT_781444 [Suillus placidus]|uniref:Uncharacterized protein n=1 Tax=Suillus placidus TaxID=48579 RepID=A0A9P7CVZ4_9AGAM|nr:hypothetical protein EV702DRAFT_781444 [Suillus placidus]
MNSVPGWTADSRLSSWQAPRGLVPREVLALNAEPDQCFCACRGFANHAGIYSKHVLPMWKLTPGNVSLNRAFTRTILFTFSNKMTREAQSVSEGARNLIMTHSSCFICNEAVFSAIRPQDCIHHGSRCMMSCTLVSREPLVARCADQHDHSSLETPHFSISPPRLPDVVQDHIASVIIISTEPSVATHCKPMKLLSNIS